MVTFWSFVLLALLGWVLVSRYTGKPDSTWPLLVWALAIVFTNAYEGSLDAIAVYFGLFLALLLRFEFMAGGVARLVRLLESVAILVLMWQLFRILRGY